MKNIQNKTQDQIKRIDYFKRIIREIAFSQHENFRSICHYLYYDFIAVDKAVSIKEWKLTDFISHDDMKLYIIAWKQVLPEIEASVRKRKYDIKQKMRECAYDTIPEHCTAGLSYLYRFRNEIRIVFRRLSGYRKPLSASQKKLVDFYSVVLCDLCFSGTLGRSIALKEVLKAANQAENYWLFIIAYKAEIGRIEKRIRIKKKFCREQQRHYSNSDISVLYMVRTIMRERVRHKVLTESLKR